MPSGQRSVRFDADRGFFRLDPVPDEGELAEFYGAEYYNSTSDRRAPDLRTLIANDDAAFREREWRNATIYSDVLHLTSELGVGGGAALDVGCGTGEFVAFLGAVAGGLWKASGIELAPDAVQRAVARGLDVTRGSSSDVDSSHDGRYDLVTMFNLLEHLPDPEGALADAHRLLRRGGVLVVQVPNDFSLLQQATRTYLEIDPWWIAVPDHINYFTFDTLSATLSAAGFGGAQRRYCSFPMEFFLLAGLDYVSNPDAGATSHRRRCDFEQAIDASTRRALYEQFANAGIGRNCVVVARRS